VQINELGTIAVVGQGYVGLPLAMAAAKKGWRVIGIDHSQNRVNEINSGNSPIEDVPNTELIELLGSSAYLATNDFAFVSEAEIIVICVPTPLDSERKPDLSLLESALRSCAPFISPQSLVVNESTSYPGTLRDLIIPIIKQSMSNPEEKLFFASAPERVNPGDLVWKQNNTPRLVGAIDKESAKRALSFYETICDSVKLVSSPEIAEAAKLLENTFRLVNIALINEFSQLCSKSSIDVYEVIDAASSKPYGFMPFRPGVGVGGHCIPVDPLYLTWWAQQNSFSAEIVELADSVNRSMPYYIASRALSMVNSDVLNPRVLILGVAYKGGLADVRETPANTLFDALVDKGANISWHDPLVPEWRGPSSNLEDWVGDVVIVTVNQPGVDLEILIEKRIPILDCTGSNTHRKNVESI